MNNNFHNWAISGTLAIAVFVSSYNQVQGVLSNSVVFPDTTNFINQNGCEFKIGATTTCKNDICKDGKRKDKHGNQVAITNDPATNPDNLRCHSHWGKAPKKKEAKMADIDSVITEWGQTEFGEDGKAQNIALAQSSDMMIPGENDYYCDCNHFDPGPTSR